MANLAKYIVQLEAQTAQYRRDLDRANQKLNRFHRNQRRRLRDVSRQWTRFRAVLGTVVSTGILTALIRQSLDQADALAKLTDRLGGTTEAYSELAFVAERSGLQFRTLELGLQRMQRRISEAAGGFGEAKGALQELGLSAAAITNLPIDQQFEIVADALAGVETEATRTRLAMKLFDSEGVALLQTMKNGAAGIRELRDRARELGITLSGEQAQAAVEAKDAITDLNTSWKALVQTLAVEAAPVLERANDRLRRFLGGETLDEEIDRLTEKLNRQVFELGFNPESFAVQRTIEALQDAGRRLEQRRGAAAVGEVGTRDLQTIEQTRDALFGLAEAQAEVNAIIANFELPATAQDAVRTFEQASEELERFNEAQRAAVNRDRDRALRLIDESNELLDDTIQKQNEAERQARNLGLTFTSAFEDAIVAGEGFRDVLDGILKDLIRIAARKLFTEPAADFIGGFISGSRATGGPVGAGKTYLVGERGPELFTPNASGYITPNGGAGGPSISYAIDARGADEATILQKMVPLLERTVEVTRESVRKDIREGRFV